MDQQLRIWRVVPTSKTGVQAPAYLVETTEFDLGKARESAIRLAKNDSGLSRFSEWVFVPTKLNLRKDRNGKYYPYHQ